MNKRFGSRGPMKEEMSLQITSMADIFTILLLFLLKSFSVGLTTITPAGDIKLPETQANDEMAETLKVEISKDVILVDDKPVTTLANYRLESNDVEANYTPRSLNSTLIKEKNIRKKSVQDKPPEERAKALAASKLLMILADQKTPYITIKSVLTSASNAGFSDFKLVVVNK